MKKRLLSLLLALAASGVGAAEDGALPSGMLAWRCWYDQKVHITCLVDTLPTAANPTSAMLPANLPPLVRQLRDNPESFRNRFVHIPLISPPSDMDSTLTLARASVCGSRPDCSVNFSPGPPTPLEIHDLLTKDFAVPDGRGEERLPVAVPGAGK